MSSTLEPIALVEPAAFLLTSERKPLRHLEVILKVSERCNINCTYCYFFDDRNQDYKTRPPLIAEDTIDALAAFLLSAAVDHGLLSIQIDFHGGEPLLLRVDRFDRMCAVFTERLASIVELRFSLQTNGMLIDEDWIDVFERHNVYVGVSLDGPAPVNDKFRIDHRGRGTYDRVAAGIEKLRARLGQKFAILSVLADGANAERSYRHFTLKLGAKNLHFLATDETHDTITDSGRKAVEHSLRAIFASWLDDNDPSIRVRFLTKAVRLMLSVSDMASANRTQAAYSAITVQSDGALGPDDDLRNILPDMFRTGMTVSNSSLRQFLDDPTIRALHADIDAEPRGCVECCWKKVCDSGRVIGGPLHRYSSANGFANPSVYCEAIQEFLAEVCETAVRRGHSINTIMEALS